MTPKLQSPSNLVDKQFSANDVWASMPHAGAPALRFAGTADQRCTQKRSAKPPHGVETVGDLIDRIRASAKPNPASSEPEKKEQLAMIRKVEQKNHADYARTKVAAELAIQAIHGAKDDVYMSDGSGFGILESEEEVQGYGEPR